MSEKEIRLILRDVIADLDRRAIRTLGKVLLPSMLGASLALGAGALSGCSQRTLPQQSDSTTITADGSVPPLPDSSSLPDGALPPDGASRPIPDSVPAVDTQPPDPPPEPAYMAPMYGVPFPEPDGGI
jgi:hypothetical protein